MINVRKQAAYLGAILLFFQAVPVSLTKAYAETEESVDPQLVEAFRSHQPKYLNLNQSMIPSETETEVVQEFSFLEKTFRTTVGQPTLLRFTSTLPANEVLVRIPANGQIVEEAFSNGESIQHSHGEYWTLKTRRQQTEFVLPIVFEKAGQYFLTIDHDADHFYLEVEEGRTEVQEESVLIEEAETDLEDQQQNPQENTDNELPVVVQPVMATENNLSISEALIAAEEARIFEEISDGQSRATTTSVSNWSQFRSAWNSNNQYVSIGVTSSFLFSSSILGSSLNKLNNGTRDIRSFSGAMVNVGTSGNSLQLENSKLIMTNVRFESENSGSQPLIELNRSSDAYMGVATQIINRRNSPAVAINDRSILYFDMNSERRIIYNEAAVSPIQLRGNSTLDFSMGGVVIGSYNASSSWVPPISSDANSIIHFSSVSHNVMMGGRIHVISDANLNVTHLTSYRIPWNSVTAEITGVNGSIVTSSNSDPNDFSERYLANYNSIEYRSITVGASASEGFVPPISTFDLSLTASPQEAGNPKADSTTIAANATTSIYANPNDGYRFVKWEIISGTNARVANETAETTTFTMGSSDAVVRAVYEKNTYSLSLRASPAEGGAPSADEDTLIDREETEIHANPNEGYRFVSWEILSGTGARLADETAETTTFTMGSSDIVLQANYEEEAVDVRPMDPLDPDKEVDPENPPTLPEDQGLFSLDFASQFDFGVQAISVQDQTYYAKPQRILAEDGTVLEGEERPNYVQVSDRRSAQERDGWELSVRQNEQFQTLSGQELTGARLVLQNQQIATAQGGIEPGLQHTNPMSLIPGGAKRTLLKAQGPEGEGTWIYRFGNAETAAQSVALEVPKGATPSADHYKTTLTWELSSVPKN